MRENAAEVRVSHPELGRESLLHLLQRFQAKFWWAGLGKVDLRIQDLAMKRWEEV